MLGREGPGDPLGSQAARDLRIIVHIDLIIVVDEVVAERLAKDEKDGQEKKTADGQD